MVTLLRSLKVLKRGRHTKHIQYTYNERLIRSPDGLRQAARLVRACNSEAGLECTSCLSEIPVTTSHFFRIISSHPELDFLLTSVCVITLERELNEETIKKLKNNENL